MGQNQWYHIGVGEFTTHFRSYFSRDWLITGGTIRILTHGKVSRQLPPSTQPTQDARRGPSAAPPGSLRAPGHARVRLSGPCACWLVVSLFFRCLPPKNGAKVSPFFPFNATEKGAPSKKTPVYMSFVGGFERQLVMNFKSWKKRQSGWT